MVGPCAATGASSARVAVLSDFDGTLTPVSTIDLLYESFAAPTWVQVTRRWECGEIGTREEFETNFASMKVGRVEMELVLDGISLDPQVPEVLAFCRERDYPFAVVSDGLVWYIEYILSRHNVRDIPIYANQVRFTAEGPRFSFPWYDASSPRRGVDKAGIVRRYQRQGFRVVFLGDGLSDMDVVGVADVLYAKGRLFEYCRARGVEALQYSSMADVLQLWKAAESAGGR